MKYTQYTYNIFYEKTNKTDKTWLSNYVSVLPRLNIDWARSMRTGIYTMVLESDFHTGYWIMESKERRKESWRARFTLFIVNFSRLAWIYTYVYIYLYIFIYTYMYLVNLYHTPFHRNYYYIRTIQCIYNGSVSKDARVLYAHICKYPWACPSVFGCVR